MLHDDAWHVLLVATASSTAPWATTADSSTMLLGPIPGSKPDWRSANIKGRGKATADAVPASLLGATGWEAWTFSQDPKAGVGK
jgi:hypothetical protein